MQRVYTVKMQSSANVSLAEKASIDQTVWLDAYRPTSSAQLVYDTARETFIARLVCKESNPLIRYHKFDDPVYTDSCLEWFCAFDPDDVRYINFEMNAAGTLLAGLGPDGDNRISLGELIPAEDIPVVKAEKSESEWSVTIEISKSVLEKIYGRPLSFASGMTLRGNFYKCGDETEIEHYVMWNPIQSEIPNYHIPAYFGTFRLTEQE